jgi:cellulose synthase/poly-beta-1,6-N-acetylglucosamine synthase-like glycosyltransferase
MGDALRILGTIVCLPWVIDAAIRRLMAGAAKSWRAPITGAGDTTIRWLVIIPARDEGAAVVPTLESVASAAAGLAVDTVLLLDGEDDAATEAAGSLPATIVVKPAPGPSKGAALKWFAEYHRERLEAADAVLLLDVGSRLMPGFFFGLGWSASDSAMQAWLRGIGAGVGSAASLSEKAAQRWQDRGRQAMGWTVELRGTGVVMTPSLFRNIVPRLRTSVEDTEATLLLAADGVPVVLAGESAVVEDIKPSQIADAARQRSRWLLGRISILVRHPRTLARLCRRQPLEGLATVCGLLSRPLVLSSLLRIAAATGYGLDATIGNGGLASFLVAAVIAISILSDLALFRRTSAVPWPTFAAKALRMTLSWCGAVLLLPQALLGWARGRRD